MMLYYTRTDFLLIHKDHVTDSPILVELSFSGLETYELNEDLTITIKDKLIHIKGSESITISMENKIMVVL